MITQKLRNYFHHVVKANEREATKSVEVSYSSLIDVYVSMEMHKWNLELAALSDKVQKSCLEGHLTFLESSKLNGLVKKDVEYQPYTQIPDEEKIHRMINYLRKTAEFNSRNEQYVPLFEKGYDSFTIGYDSWTKTNCRKLDL